MLNFWIDEDWSIQWEGAKGTDATGTEVPLNAATVTYTLRDRNKVAVAGGTGTLAYQTGSAGNYLGTVESTVTGTLNEGEVYYLDIRLTQEPYNGFRRLKGEARYRQGDDSE